MGFKWYSPSEPVSGFKWYSPSEPVSGFKWYSPSEPCGRALLTYSLFPDSSFLVLFLQGLRLSYPYLQVTLRRDSLDVVEEDYYTALYNESQAHFNTYVDAGTLLNNYAHIFDLLRRLRQLIPTL
ncbi:uncharacterized protein LOC125190798 isoform X2 [Salvia hispanica]|uniref:uncharacterized protein LOC125190798 isoform X2 n=1 Tax=Salvia hispanica TaxID=49212 RepID=UPI002008F26F|nr:uncharacterized protein LOC125190798 isoform X2 [Salvia hispanica]